MKRSIKALDLVEKFGFGSLKSAMSVTWCAVAANFWVFQQIMICRYCCRRQQFGQCDECAAGRGINHFKMAQSPANKQD